MPIPGLTGIPFVPALVPIAFDKNPPPDWLIEKGAQYMEVPNDPLVGIPPSDYTEISRAWERFAHWQAKIGLIFDELEGS